MEFGYQAAVFFSPHLEGGKKYCNGYGQLNNIPGQGLLRSSVECQPFSVFIFK